MKKKLIIIFVLIVAIIGGLYLVSNSTKTEEVANTYIVETKDMVLSYLNEGKVESEKTISVYSSTSGKVKKIYKRVWDSVKKGDILLEIDKSSIDTLETNIEKTKLQLQALTKTYEINKELYQNGLVSKNSLEKIQDEVKIAKLEYDKLLRDKNKVELEVKTPISGIITYINADENYTIDLSKALFTISDTDNLKVVISLPNTKVKNLKIGDIAKVTSSSLPNGEELTGRITSIEKISSINSQYNDSETNIIVKLENNSTLKPGDLVDVNIIYEEKENQIYVPLNYINSEIDGKIYVYIINKKNEVEKRNIEILNDDGQNYYVKSGLAVGDELLDNSSLKYKEGDKIKKHIEEKVEK